MNHSTGYSWLLSLPLAFLLIGCSSRPDSDIALAEKAKAQAKEQRASEFAPGDWKSAEEAMSEAEAAIARERYGESRTMLLRAKSRYEKARDIAKGKRDVILIEVQNLQKTIDIRYKTLKDNITNSAGKLSAAKKKTLDEYCQDIDKGIEKLKVEIDQGEYPQAQETANLTMRQVYEGEKELLGQSASKKKS